MRLKESGCGLSADAYTFVSINYPPSLNDLPAELSGIVAPRSTLISHTLHNKLSYPRLTCCTSLCCNFLHLDRYHGAVITTVTCVSQYLALQSEFDCLLTLTAFVFHANSGLESLFETRQITSARLLFLFTYYPFFILFYRLEILSHVHNKLIICLSMISLGGKSKTEINR